jgi:hypothetical protein
MNISKAYHELRLVISKVMADIKPNLDWVLHFIISNCTFKGKVKLTHEGVWESGCIDPHFLDLGTSWR